MYSLPCVVMSSASCARGEREDSGLLLVRAMLVGVWEEAGGGVCGCSSWNIHVNSIHIRKCVR